MIDWNPIAEKIQRSGRYPDQPCRDDIGENQVKELTGPSPLRRTGHLFADNAAFG